MPTEKQRISGLILRGKTWWIDKKISGKRICESCRTSNYEESVKYFAFRVNELREAAVYGTRPKRIWRAAAIHYLETKQKATLSEDIRYLKILDKWIGDLALENVHIGTMQPFIDGEKARGVKSRTINYPLQLVRHILNLASSEWIDDTGKTWLANAPKIKLLPVNDKRQPYPLDWSEQIRLFNALPVYLRDMALFKVNTGTREGEVCDLRWDWEVPIPELQTSVFIIPVHKVKNRKDDRLVVLNSIAKDVVEKWRGIHPEFVFSYKGRQVKKMYVTSWKTARRKVGLPLVRVHDLKHTYGRRLRSVGVDTETRKDLLGHFNREITTHYSAPELENLIAASEKVCVNDSRKSHTVVMLKRNFA
ncbi:MAG: tyrosine-type recombinase/integrase [Desulfomonilaceae bacterium]